MLFGADEIRSSRKYLPDGLNTSAYVTTDRLYVPVKPIQRRLCDRGRCPAVWLPAVPTEKSSGKLIAIVGCDSKSYHGAVICFCVMLGGDTVIRLHGIILARPFVVGAAFHGRTISSTR